MITPVYKQKTLYELFQICELILNVSRLPNSKMNSVSFYHVKIFLQYHNFCLKYGKNAIRTL